MCDSTEIWGRVGINSESRLEGISMVLVRQ